MEICGRMDVDECVLVDGLMEVVLVALCLSAHCRFPFLPNLLCFFLSTASGAEGKVYVISSGGEVQSVITVAGPELSGLAVR
jgi:hypothetical protein